MSKTTDDETTDHRSTDHETTGTRAAVAQVFAAFEARDWVALAAVLHEDVVYDLPQSRERIVGRERYVQFNAEYPGDWHVVPTTVVVECGHAAVRFDWRVGDEQAEGVVFYETAGGLVTRITDFWPEPYEPPPGREHLVERY